jgi:hypothetical protein
MINPEFVKKFTDLERNISSTRETLHYLHFFLGKMSPTVGT